LTFPLQKRKNERKKDKEKISNRATNLCNILWSVSLLWRRRGFDSLLDKLVLSSVQYCVCCLTEKIHLNQRRLLLVIITEQWLFCCDN